MISRDSSCECRGSGIANDRASPKAVAASSDDAPCLVKIDRRSKWRRSQPLCKQRLSGFWNCTQVTKTPLRKYGRVSNSVGRSFRRDNPAGRGAEQHQTNPDNPVNPVEKYVTEFISQSAKRMPESSL